MADVVASGEAGMRMALALITALALGSGPAAAQGPTAGQGSRQVQVRAPIGAPAANTPTASTPASARPGQGAPGFQAVTREDPVTFTADAISYDRDSAVVTASGNVEAWQNDNVLRADRITFDRNTNVAAASGNVVLVGADGQVLFSDYAELTAGLRDGVLRGMRGLLAENGRLAANGARRTGGVLNELSRAVYTTCNLCADDPTRPPLWQLRARSVLQDTENKRVEYRDATLDLFGQPVAFIPYFWHADPSVRRASGFLVPSFGQSDRLGTFLTVPYYIAIDDYSDATLAPTVGLRGTANLAGQFRRRFNDGEVNINASVGYEDRRVNADIFASGRFSLDETWRYGFDLNRASASRYLRDFRVSNRGDVLTSQAYLEGFGVGSYSRLNVTAYQGLVATIAQSRLPYVLPRYQYSYFGEVDRLGGRFSFETQDFNVLRPTGTNTQRASASFNWQRPFTGAFGEVYGLTLQADTAAYVATSLGQGPNYSTRNSAQLARAHPQVAFEARWPLVRDAGQFGTQLVEPIAQLIVSPNTGGLKQRRIPNEDSLDFEFTDANLFALNRFPGIDRHEGGTRANVGLRASWSVGGAVLDGLVGQSYRLSRADDTFPPESGLERRVSDIVARATAIPAPWLDVTARTRLDYRSGDIRFADVVASTGAKPLRLSAGYIRTSTNPYNLYGQAGLPADYFTPRDEITVGATSQIGEYSFAGYARRDLRTAQMTSVGARATYEDECFIFDVNVNRRYTSLNGDRGATLVLFQVTFKTVGQFGFNAF